MNMIVGIIVGAIIGNLILYFFGNPLIWLDGKYTDYKYKKYLKNQEGKRNE